MTLIERLQQGVQGRDLVHQPLQFEGLYKIVIGTLFHAVNNRTGTQEEQRLKESVRHQVESGCHIGPHPERGDHIAELRNC